MKARILACVSVLVLLAAFTVHAQGTAFTYQGRLNVNGSAASGNFDLRFGLYTNLTTGNEIGNLLTNTAVAVTNGAFTTTLDFGNAFTGVPYWLEIGVRTNGSTGVFTTLMPRQAVTPTPYAITAENATNLLGTLPASQLTGTLSPDLISGIYSNAVSLTNSANIISGVGTGLTGLITPTQGNYLFAYDNNTQAITTANTYQTITLSSAPSLNGWAVTNGVLTAPVSGLYLVTYAAQIENTAGYTVVGGVRGLLNGATEIIGSESLIYINAASTTVGTKTFLLPMTGGQKLAFQMTANLASGYVAEFSGSFDGATLPGMTVTIVRLQ
jgi:hypothetical protein